MRLPPRGVRRFLGWHVLKLEFWHFPLPKFILRFLFLSVSAVFLAKKRAHGGLHWSKNLLGGPFRVVFFGVFLSVSPFASVFAVFWPSLDFLHMPASTCTCFFFELCAGVWGGGGGWGGDGGGGGG